MGARKLTTVLVAVLLLSATLVAVTAAAVNAEDPKLYTVDIEPETVVALSTEAYTVEIGLDASSKVTLGAARVSIPAELSVVGDVDVIVPGGKTWTDPADPLGNGTYESLAATQGDRLDPGETVTFSFDATAVVGDTVAVFSYDIRQSNNFNGQLNVVDPHPTLVETDVTIVGTVVACTSGSCEGSTTGDGGQIGVSGECTETDCGAIVIDVTGDCPDGFTCEGGVVFWDPTGSTLDALVVTMTFDLEEGTNPNKLTLNLEIEGLVDSDIDWCKRGAPPKNQPACILDSSKTKTTVTFVVLVANVDPLGFVSK